MSYLVIEDFSRGLDSQRFALTAQRGSLVTLTNAVISTGREVRKRGRFVKYTLPAGTVGLEATLDNLVVFGSDAAPSDLPSNVVYQQLQHPAVLRGSAPDSNHVLTRIVSSTTFAGKVFAIAEFADGQRFAYFDGVAIDAWYRGRALSGRNDTATILADAVKDVKTLEGIYWTTEDRGSNKQLIYGHFGTNYTFTLTPDPSSYALDMWGSDIPRDCFASKVADANAGTPETVATARFNIDGSLPLGYITKLKLYNSTGLYIFDMLRGHAVAWTHTSTKTKETLVAAINAHASPWTATLDASTGEVVVAAPPHLGSLVNGYYIEVVTYGGGPNVIGSPATFSGGVDSVNRYGDKWIIGFDGTWNVGDTYGLVVNSNGVDYDLGGGWTTDAVPTFSLAVGDRVYVLDEQTVYCSAVGDATGWTNNDVGAGYIRVELAKGASAYAGDDIELVSLGTYQGGLAVLGRRKIHLWDTAADITNFNRRQVLDNIGTFAKNSVGSLGQLDLIFLYDSGIRSLRVRDTSLNAIVIDIGTPIDELVRAKLAECSDAEKAAACAVVCPSDGRYWLFLKDTIYVLSYYPLQQVSAWSTFTPTYEDGGVQVQFTPERFVVWRGHVYCRADNAIYKYEPDVYDNCEVVVQTPWLYLDKPGTFKLARAVDIAGEGSWKLYVGMDPQGSLDEVGTLDGSTFLNGRVEFGARGTHFSIKLTTASAVAARLSQIVFHFNEAEPK